MLADALPSTRVLPGLADVAFAELPFTRCVCCGICGRVNVTFSVPAAWPMV
jgi:hypothetical protein